MQILTDCKLNLDKCWARTNAIKDKFLEEEEGGREEKIKIKKKQTKI